MDGGIYLVGVGGLISALLSIIAYFLHYLHRDFRKMQGDLVELKAETRLIKVDLTVFARLLGLNGAWSHFQRPASS